MRERRRKSEQLLNKFRERNTSKEHLNNFTHNESEDAIFRMSHGSGHKIRHSQNLNNTVQTSS
jgi:hypothetical protein